MLCLWLAGPPPTPLSPSTYLRSTPYPPFIEAFLTSHLDHAKLLAAEEDGTDAAGRPPPRLRKPVLLEEFGKKVHVGKS